jgi:hypothetical protein
MLVKFWKDASLGKLVSIPISKEMGTAYLRDAVQALRVDLFKVS